MTAKKFNLPSWLQRSEAEVAEEAKTQSERRAGFTRAHLTEGERLIQRGTLLEETARGNLAAGAGDDARALLAEGLAMQGRYLEAAEHHPNKMMSAEYRSIQHAINLPDEEKCACPDDEVGDITITPRFNARTVFSVRHGGTVMLVTCRKCGHRNGRPPHSRLLLQNAATNTNNAQVRAGLRPALDDARVLKKPNART